MSRAIKNWEKNVHLAELISRGALRIHVEDDNGDRHRMFERIVAQRIEALMRQVEEAEKKGKKGKKSAEDTEK